MGGDPRLRKIIISQKEKGSPSNRSESSDMLFKGKQDEEEEMRSKFNDKITKKQAKFVP
jgi:hypothetical protein